MIQAAKPPKTPLRSLDEGVDRIRQRWGFPLKKKTLRNDICEGKLLAVYVGVRPFLTDADIDNYARSKIRSESPRRTATRRRRAAAETVSAGGAIE